MRTRKILEPHYYVVDVYGNECDFDIFEEAYRYCYNYIEKALCDDPEEFKLALDELSEYNEATDLIGYKVRYRIKKEFVDD